MFSAFCDYFLLFMMYSFIGWIIEVINFIFISKKVVDRGFLIGPYLPIYGFGALAIIIFLQKYSSDLITLFCMCMIICCVLEYFTSFIMEKLFHARWWDYSNERFNIEGRVCLKTTVLFGFAGSIILCVVNPLLLSILSMVPSLVKTILTVILFIIFVIDVLISFKVIFTFRTFTQNVRKDSTSEFNKLVKKMISSKSILGKRLMQAFPNLKLSFKEFTNKKIRLSARSRK